MVGGFDFVLVSFSPAAAARIFFTSLSAMLNRYSIQLVKLVTFASLESLATQATAKQFKLVDMNTCTNLHVMQSIKSDFMIFFSLSFINCLQSGSLLAQHSASCCLT